MSSTAILRALLATGVAGLALLLLGAESRGSRYEIEVGQPVSKSGHFVFRLDTESGEICSWRQASMGVGGEGLDFLGCSNKRYGDG